MTDLQIFGWCIFAAGVLWIPAMFLYFVGQDVAAAIRKRRR